MPYSDELDRYLHVRADRRALRVLRDRYPDEYEAAYDGERAEILSAMAAKVSPAPVSVAAVEDPEQQRPEPHAGEDAEDPVEGTREADAQRLDAAVVEHPAPDQHADDEVVATADGESGGQVAEHVAHGTKSKDKPPIICDVCLTEVPRTGRPGKPRQRHESCQVAGRIEAGVSRETSQVQDAPVAKVIELPSYPPIPAPVVQDAPSPVQDVQPATPVEPEQTRLYEPDPNGPPDDPDWHVCGGCGLGINPQTLSCGCRIGVLGDDDAPADARFRYLGPSDDY